MKLHLKSILTRNEVAHARQVLATADWVDGRVTSGTQYAAIKNNRQLPEQGAASVQLQALVLAALRRSQMFFSAALPARIGPPLFNHYDNAHNFLADHGDVALRMLADGGSVRTDLSGTLFLSDPDEYEGGELVIRDSWRDEVVKLAAGDLFLYPANTIHRVEPVRQGHRYACFFWTQSLVRSNEQRSLLFDMDCHLMRLRGELSEGDPAVVGLGATYHNLLRMWAEN